MVFSNSAHLPVNTQSCKRGLRALIKSPTTFKRNYLIFFTILI